MFKLFRKRRAMRAYRRQLGVKLRKRYGREKHYTPEQVRTTAISSNLGVDYLCFALAMYCDRDAFDAYHLAEGEACDYDAMRADIGNTYFGGDASFDATTFDAPDAGASCDSGSDTDGFDCGDFGDFGDFGGDSGGGFGD